MARKYTESKDGVSRCNFTITLRLSRSQMDEHNKKAKALGYTSFRSYANERAHIITEELILEYSYQITEQASALLESHSNFAKAEAYQLPDSPADISIVDSVPSGKEIWGYNENGELVSEAGFKFLVADSEGANEGTIPISPAEPIANLDLTTIRSQSDGEPTAINIVAPGKDGPSTILETIKLDGVNPVTTKGFYFLGRSDDSEETK